MVDPIGEMAKAVAKQLPMKEAYGDALSPGMRQVGGAVEDIAKTLRIALLPFEAAGALYDRISGLIDESLRRVPAEKRAAPPPQILGPVVEGARFEEPGTPISEMFAELLAKAFNKDEVAKAHPSYPALIRQLSGDEAVLLQLLWKHHQTGSSPKIQFTMDWVPTSGRFVNRVVEIDEVPRLELAFPDNRDFYIDHLHALGLAGIYKDDEKPIHDPSGLQTGTRVYESLRLSPMGVRFMEAVGKPPS